MKAKHLCLLAAAVCLCVGCGREYDTARFREKTELLRQEALADWVRQELGDAPAGVLFRQRWDENCKCLLRHRGKRG